jgi:hypothetical protein
MDDTVRPLTESQALARLRELGTVESVTAASGLFAWERTKTQRALTRWEREGAIAREPGPGGRTVIRVPGAALPAVRAPADPPALHGSPDAHPPAQPDAQRAHPARRRALGPILAGAALALRHAAAIIVGAVGIGLSAMGMVETASYSMAFGFLFCAKAIGADALTLTMPPTIRVLWRRRSPAVALAFLMWCAGVVVTVSNIAGYVGEHVEQHEAGRETGATERAIAMERLARLRSERKAMTETRPPGAIVAAINDARRSEQPALREALAMAKRRDALDPNWQPSRSGWPTSHGSRRLMRPRLC